MTSDAPDAYIPPDAIARQTNTENEALHQSGQMVLQSEAELGGKNLLNEGILRATSGNPIKQLGTRRETCLTTQAKNATTIV